jgi:NAD(P)-dependent dehydrogenase (short-subunit alcohol dehydrogenase family)
MVHQLNHGSLILLISFPFRVMAVDLAPKGINVNSIAPGVHTTEMTGALVDNATQSVKAVPNGRYATITPDGHCFRVSGFRVTSRNEPLLPADAVLRAGGLGQIWLGAWLGAW